MTRLSNSNNNDFLIYRGADGLIARDADGERFADGHQIYGSRCFDQELQVKARTYTATTQIWSALKDVVFSVGPVAENLRISEVMYHPDGDPNSEFLELYNSGSETLDLSLVRFEKGIDFTFGLTPTTTTIGPNGYLVLAKNPAAFSARYPAVPVAGQYGGALDSNGERIRLVDALGWPIADFAYSNNWFDITDGEGFSLTLRNPRWDNSRSRRRAWCRCGGWTRRAGTAVWDSQGAHPGQTAGNPVWRPTGRPGRRRAGVGRGQRLCHGSRLYGHRGQPAADLYGVDQDDGDGGSDSVLGGPEYRRRDVGSAGQFGRTVSGADPRGRGSTASRR